MTPMKHTNKARGVPPTLPPAKKPNLSKPYRCLEVRLVKGIRAGAHSSRAIECTPLAFRGGQGCGDEFASYSCHNRVARRRCGRNGGWAQNAGCFGVASV